MDAGADYNIVIAGTHEDVKAIGEVLKETITDKEFDIDRTIIIKFTRCCFFYDDIIELVKRMARASKESSFIINGRIDESDVAGEYIDFEFTFFEGRLTSRFSPWYVYDDLYSEDYEDYEFGKEEYDLIKKNGIAYIIELPGGNVMAENVPLDDVTVLEY